MKPNRTVFAPPARSLVCLELAAHGTIRVMAEAIAGLRQTRPFPSRKSLSPSLLKHSDEQTVAGSAAVFQAIEKFGLADTRFTDWAVLAAPRYIGRSILAVSLNRFAREGAWGVSPHLVPHRSLHSLSGTISQALEIHGPNFGVGGGPQSASEAFLAAAALLADGKLPGLWLVLAGWDPEQRLDHTGLVYQNGHLPPPSYCLAVALALKNVSLSANGGCLTVTAESPATCSAEPVDFSLERLYEFLTAPKSTRATWTLAGAGRIEIEKAKVGVENRL